MSKLKSPKNRSSWPNFANLYLAKLPMAVDTTCKIFCRWIFIQKSPQSEFVCKSYGCFTEQHVFASQLGEQIQSALCISCIWRTIQSFDMINLIDLLMLWLGLCVSLNSDGGYPTGMSNSSHDHRSEDMKQELEFHLCHAYLHMHTPRTYNQQYRLWYHCWEMGSEKQKFSTHNHELLLL